MNEQPDGPPPGPPPKFKPSKFACRLNALLCGVNIHGFLMHLIDSRFFWAFFAGIIAVFLYIVAWANLPPEEE